VSPYKKREIGMLMGMTTIMIQCPSVDVNCRFHIEMAISEFPFKEQAFDERNNEFRCEMGKVMRTRAENCLRLRTTDRQLWIEGPLIGGDAHMGSAGAKK
jgi:hypothetical protein